MERLSLPFVNRFWTDAYDAMVTVHGVLRTEPEGLVLEVRSNENAFGARPTREGEIRTSVIPWTEVQAIEYRRRFLLGGTVLVRTRSLRALDGVPGARGSELSLAVSRADRLAARELAVNVELALAEHRLLALDPPTGPRLYPSA
jgi:hypothetical protein